MGANFLYPRLPLLQMAAVSFSSSGDNTLIAAITNKAILVHRIFLVTTSATNLTFKRGSTSLSGALPMAANGGITLDVSGEPWFSTAISEAFIVNSSNAVAIGGAIYYDVYPPL